MFCQNFQFLAILKGKNLKSQRGGSYIRFYVLKRKKLISVLKKVQNSAVASDMGKEKKSCTTNIPPSVHLLNMVYKVKQFHDIEERD